MFSYHSESLPLQLQETALQYLKFEVPWKRIKYYSAKRKGSVSNPRATWVCGFHRPYLYKVNGITPEPFPQKLHELIKWMQTFTGAEYNFMLFSKYETGNDSITWHSDDEKFITKDAPITSITILDVGADPRTFYLKDLYTKQKHAWDLQSGDIFKMDYICQQKYQHAILKQPKRKGTRYSITFRHAANELGTKNYYTYN